MKSCIACVILLLAVVTNPTFSQISHGTIKGEIIDSATKKPLDFVSVTLEQKGIVKAQVLSDDDGAFRINNLAPGYYTIKIRYIGYHNMFRESIRVCKDSVTTLRIMLKTDSSTILANCVITAKAPVIRPDGVSSSPLKLATRNINSIAGTVAGVDSRSGATPALRGSRAEGTAYYIDGVRVSGSTRSSSSKHAETSTKQTAGILTAGELNDFSKWELWKDISGDQLSKFQEEWNLNMLNRYSVQVMTPNKQPLADCTAKLIDKSGKTIWESRTDNTGKAELWADLSGVVSGTYRIVVSYRDQQKELTKIARPGAQPNLIELDADCKQPELVDIAFVVDATGSMADEIDYLKAELMDIMKQVKSANPALTYRLGSVFYRDQQEEYLVRSSPLSGNIDETCEFIAQQSAKGGGDYPEALDDALETALNDFKWSEKARTRIMFVLLDAPPHNDSGHIKRMHTIMQKSAAMGVRIVPVISSDSDKSCEYLMRAAALATNGTYVFLTNHSGVGNNHIKPTTDTYTVETLNGLLKKIIYRFTYMPSCNKPLKQDLQDMNDTMIISQRVIAVDTGDITPVLKQYPVDSLSASQYIIDSALDLTTASADSSLQPLPDKGPVRQPEPKITEQMVLRYYPNPAQGQLQVDISKDITILYLYDISGKLVMEIPTAEKEHLEIDLSFYATGTYFLKCIKDEKWLSGKIMLVR